MRHQLFSECAAKRFATDEAEVENDKPSQQKPLGAYSESRRCTKGRQASLRGARRRVTGKTISAFRDSASAASIRFRLVDNSAVAF